MITKENFTTEFDGHFDRYSCYLIIGTTINDVITFLNSYNGDICIGSGEEENGNVHFEIINDSPNLVYNITKALNTIGYADTDWYATYTVCAKNGKDFNDFTAEWEEDGFYYRDDDDLWDAFVKITDHQSGAVFHAGAGAVDEDTMLYYKDIVKTH